MILVAMLTVRPEELKTFRAYEHQAALVMAKHGGAIERVVEIPAEKDGDPHREVHIVTFPDEGAYEAYRVDPDMANFRAMREASVIKSDLLSGHEGPDYLAD